VNRRRRQAISGLAATVWAAVWLAGIHGGGAQPPETPPGVLERVRPDVYYLRDATGKLIPVPDLSLEEYQQWLQQQGQGPLPPFAVNSVEVWGRLGEDRAEVEARIDFRVDRNVPDALRVPLAFFPAVLYEYRYEGPGIAALSLDRNQSSYVLWLRTGPATRHVVTLRLVVPVRKTGFYRRLELNLPDALTHLEFLSPFPRVDFAVEGQSFLVKPLTVLADSTSKIELDGYGGKCALRFRPMGENRDGEQPFLQVNAQVSLVVVDPTYLRAEMQIAVRSEAVPWDRFHVRLPVGMTLQPYETPGFFLQIVEPGSTTTGPLVAVSRTTASPAPAMLSLSGEVRRPAPSTAWEAASLDVVEAIYQRTELVVRVEGSWAVWPLAMRQVRRLGGLTPAEREQGTVAKFVYLKNRQDPPSLKLQIQPQPSIVSIEPHYFLRITADRAWLEMYLRFFVRGAPAQGFDLWTGDWKFNRIEPRDWLGLQPVAPSNDQRVLNVPLDASKLPGSGSFDLHLSAEMPLELSSQDPVSLTLPMPQNSPSLSNQSLSVLPATVVVAEGPGVELAPVHSLMPALLPAQPRAAAWLTDQLGQAQSAELRFVFQGRSTEEPLRVVCGVRRRPVALRVRSQAEITLSDQGWRVNQVIVFEVQHQAISALTLELAELSAEKPLQVLLDDEPITGTINGGQAGRSRLAIPVQKPLLGLHTLRIDYTVPLALDNSRVVDSRVVPLAIFAPDHPITQATTECRIAEETVRLGWQVEGTGWQSIQDLVGGMPVYRWEGMASNVPLKRSSALGGPFVTDVRRAWIQTVLSAQARVDRAVFRMRTRAASLRVRLPEGASSRRDDVMVALNGQLWTDWSWRAMSELEIVPRVEGPTDTVVEIWYATDPVPLNALSATIELPRVEGVSALYPVYWELIVPARYHLISGAAGWTPQFQWQWNGLYARRVNQLTPRQLEDWTGAVHAPGLPLGVNRYVFASVGSVPQTRLSLLGRGWIVLVASSFVIALAWLWSGSAWRRTIGMLVCAALVLVAALISPDQSILVAQAAVFGWIGWLLVLATRLFSGKPRRPVRPGRVSTVVTAEPVGALATAVTASLGEVYQEASSGVQRS
jgi:hypothetical protein